MRWDRYIYEKKTLRFSIEEKVKAEIIFDQLKGMSVISAYALLRKCQKALLGSTVDEIRSKFQSKE